MLRGVKPETRLAKRDSSALWGFVNSIPKWENHHRPFIKSEVLCRLQLGVKEIDMTLTD